mgnify:FL=1
MRNKLRYMLALITAVLGINVQAQTTPDPTVGTHVTDAALLADGTYLALQCRDTNGGAGYFFTAGAVKTSSLKFQNIYVLEKGDAGYYMKRVKDNKYVAGTSGTITEADSKDNAIQVTISVPGSADITNWTTKNSDTDADQTMRFTNTSATMYINSQAAGTKPTWASGKGGFSIWYVWTFTQEQVDDIKAKAELKDAYDAVLAQAAADIAYMKTTENKPSAYSANIVTDASKITSPKSDSAEGTSMGALIDSDYSTYWHSDWHAGSAASDNSQHYLLFDLGEAHNYLQMHYARRISVGNDHPTKFLIEGSNDGTTFTEITTHTLTNDEQKDNVTSHWELNNTEAYRYVRVRATMTDNWRGYWHAAEMNFSYATEFTIGAQLYTKAGQTAKDLEAEIAAPKAEPTAEELADVKAKADIIHGMIYQIEDYRVIYDNLNIVGKGLVANAEQKAALKAAIDAMDADAAEAVKATLKPAVLANDRKFIVTTSNRGYLNGSETAATASTSTYANWAILQYGTSGHYYLYDTDHNKFLGTSNLNATDAPDNHYEINNWDDDKTEFQLKSLGTNKFLMINGASTLLITDGWSQKDAGDVWYIYDNGAADNTAALQKVYAFEGGVLTPSEATDIDNLTSGWYQMQYVGPGWTTAQYNKFIKTVNISSAVLHSGDYYELQTTDDQTAFNTLVYVNNTGETGTTKDALATKLTTITLATGNGIGKGGSRTNFAANKVGITSPDTDKTALGLYFTVSSNYGDVFTKGDVYPLGAGASQKQVRFHLYKIDVDALYDVYTVAYDAAITGTPTVTYNKSGYTGVTELTLNGSIFVSKGEAPTADQFTTTASSGATTKAVIDTDAKTITVKLAATQQDMQEAYDKGTAALAQRGVGYPTTTCTAYTDLAAATEDVKSHITEPSADILNAFNEKYQAYCGTTDIELPAAGNFYAIREHRYNTYVDGGSFNPGTPTAMKGKVSHTAKNGELSATQIWYIGSDNKGYCFGTGFGLKNATEKAGVTDAQVFTFEAKSDKADLPKTFAVRVPKDGTNAHWYIWDNTSANYGYVDRNGNTYSANNCQFYLEQITSLPVTVNADGYASLCLPVATTIPAGVKVYVAGNEEKDGTIDVGYIPEDDTVLPANCAAFIEATPGTYNFVINNTEDALARPLKAASTTTSHFKGTTAAIATPANAVILAVDNAETKLSLAPTTATELPGFSMYYQASQSETEIALTKKGLITALQVARRTDLIDGETYNINGQQVKKANGLIIVNGQKYLVK